MTNGGVGGTRGVRRGGGVMRKGEKERRMWKQKEGKRKRKREEDEGEQWRGEMERGGVSEVFLG